MDSTESADRAATVNELLSQLGMADSAVARWWDRPCGALDNRTPARVWRHDHLAVEAVVADLAGTAEQLDRRCRRTLGTGLAAARTA
jgi:hypothetical protein